MLLTLLDYLGILESLIILSISRYIGNQILLYS